MVLCPECGKADAEMEKTRGADGLSYRCPRCRREFAYPVAKSDSGEPST